MEKSTTDPEEDDWPTHIEKEIAWHKQSFEGLGWTFQEDLPIPKKNRKADPAGEIVLPKEDDYPLSHLPGEVKIGPPRCP